MAVEQQGQSRRIVPVILDLPKEFPTLTKDLAENQRNCDAWWHAVQRSLQRQHQETKDAIAALYKEPE